ncbi:preprotein translocase subunit SecD [Arcanobacterium haemolyticum]|uniref:protein translocase subunit SecD n=1 Tax=Arcanobacterium haemolyticum TaxID=28264 RepID=UPI000D91F4F1|nr:protein translocase subunit SecD [Arcanobacterium haemolyticum]SPT74473.1 preprotein translocase subunit SecD [Arcanobacterium haemolyticum]
MQTSRDELSKQSKPIGRLITLTVMIVALFAALGFGTFTGAKNRFLPELALDLEGGTQIILTPATTDGSEVTDEDVKQAIEIIRQRVDASGVAEAEITAQGGSNIIVALPGQPDKATLDLVRTSAVLRMRPVLSYANPKAISKEDLVKQLGDKAQGLDPKTMTDEQYKDAVMKLADKNGDGQLSDAPEQTPANASDPAWITEQVVYNSLILECGSKDQAIASNADDPAKALVSCEPGRGTKYILGPAELEGSQISSASSGPSVNQQGQPDGGFAVHMNFNSEGSKKFAEVTGRISKLKSPQNQFAIVLDGKTVSAPKTDNPITGGQAQITGSFKAKEAANLANQLNFGSLPLFFEVQSEEQISATLGAEQLESGLIAGLFGILFIVLYMIWQYHALGLVAIASIAVSTGLSFFVISLLSWTMDYRLSMAGVLGIIISVGVTADSFIVYFERIRDEIRDGRTIRGGIEHGWERARRTIIISDVVNLVAASVLFILTVGSVRGFAFTLGVTTVLDLIVVMMFTYPIMHYLGKTAYFGEGKRGSGLDADKLERTPIYRGRAYSAPKRTKKTRTVRATGASGNVDLHDYEYPDERFLDKKETLAQRRARERRERKAAAQEGEN